MSEQTVPIPSVCKQNVESCEQGMKRGDLNKGLTEGTETMEGVSWFTILDVRELCVLGLDEIEFDFDGAS